MAELDSLQLSITPQRRHPRKMTYADLNRLTYLQATIKVASTLCATPFDATDVSGYLTVLRPLTLQVYAMHCASSLWLNILYSRLAHHDANSAAAFACQTG